MENLDISNGFSINSNSTKPDVSQKQEIPQMKAQTKKVEASLVQKEIVKTMKGDVDNVQKHQEHCLMLS